MPSLGRWIAGVVAGLALGLCPAAGAEHGAPEAGPAPAAKAAPAAGDERIDLVREKYKKASDPNEQLTLAAELLRLVDEAGDGRSPEAQRLVEQLAAAAPDDPLLAWRRADGRRRMEDYEGAIEDLQRLVQVHPEHPLAIRARRALPGLFLRSGRREQAAQADEYLLTANLGDPSSVLARLARTYAQTNDVGRVRDTLQRLERVDPDRARYDADMAWLAADAADRLGTRQEGGAALLHFANQFGRDARRSEALLRAARSYQGQGQQEFALKLMEQSVQEANTQQVEIAGRLGRGEVLETLGQRTDAREEYDRVFRQSSDTETAARALGRAVDLTVELEGREAALAVLVTKIANGNQRAAAEAREQFTRIANGMSEELSADGEKSAFVCELARRAGVDGTLAPEIRLAAASLRERVGAYEHAALIYQPLAAAASTTSGDQARSGLARTRPREAAAGSAPADPERLRALERELAWTQLLKALGTPDKTTTDASRTLGARAAFMSGDPAWSRELLEPVKNPGPEAAVLRGDARALANDWAAACRDYHVAEGPELAPAMSGWLQLRLAACEFRDGKVDEARARLAVLQSAKPAEPVLVAAELLQEQLPQPKPQPAAKPRRSPR